MKFTRLVRRTSALPCLFALALAAVSSAANPYNDGTSHIISADTNFNGTLYVGIQNPDNSLLIGSNATALATDVVIGQLTSSTNNSVTVDGDALLIAGSATTNGLTTGGVVVGSSDAGAALSIGNASSMNTDYLYLGMSTNESAGVSLSGEGSALNVAQDAYIGYAGSSNTVDIGSGALLNIGGTLTVGSIGESNNIVDVASGGALYVGSTNRINVVDAEADNGITVQGGGTLQVGGDFHTGTFDELGIDMEAKANLELGGTLTLAGNKIDSQLGITMNGTLSTNTASWSSGSLTAIGATTSDNALTFTNGATGHALNIVQVGQGTTARRNELNIGGSNTLFTADSDVFIGAQGDDNQLHVSDGGVMDVAGNLYLGNNASASGNAVNIHSNGTLLVEGEVLVGDNGSANTFTVTDGLVDVTDDFILGSASGNNRYNQTGGTNTVGGTFLIGVTENATGDTGFVNDDRVETTGNLAIIGEGATLDVANGLTVGLEGGGSIMTIRDGGTVNIAGDTVIGDAVGDNYIYLQRGSNTAFNVTGDLIVGKEGGSNRFAVYGGTADIGGSLYLGNSTNQHDVVNFIHLETTNAVLQVNQAVHIGALNSDNTLDIVDGAALQAQDMLVGAYEGVSNNVVTVSGNDALLDVAGSLEIGSATGTDNSVIVEEGGILGVQQAGIVLSGTNNVLKIMEGGTLKTEDWDFALLTGSATNIVLESGSILHMLGMLDGTNSVEGGMNYILDGTNAAWNTSSTLYVGDSTDENSLTLTNGATASTATNLYLGYASTENSLTIGGTGSVLTVGHDLFIGTRESGSSFNTLFVTEGGGLTVSNNANLFRGAVLKIGSTAQVSVLGNYEQDQYSILEIGVSSNQVQPNLLVAGAAAFANSSDIDEFPIIKVYDEGISESNVITIVQADSITVGGEKATTGNLQANIQTNLLLGFSITVSNGLDNTFIILDDFIERTIGEAGNLDGQLLEVADEITLLEQAGNSNAIAMTKIIADMSSESEVYSAMNNYYGEEMSSAPANNAIYMGIQSVAEQLTKRADNTRARMGTAHADPGAPSGAQGPHLKDQELQGWMTGFRTWADRSSTDGFDGYEGSMSGFLIGADFALEDGLLFGVAGGSTGSSLDKDNGGSSDTRTLFGSVYASAGTTDWFADASFIYGNSSIDYTLGTTFDTAADYDAQNVALYIGGGKEMTGDYLIFTPQASLLGNYYKQDSYEEKSSNAVARDVDSFNTFYLQSSIGCNVGFYTAMGDSIMLKPDFRAFWLHEFNSDEEDLSYSLVGGAQSYTLQLQAPVSDLIKLGAGVSAKMGQYLELRADLDARMGSGYSDYTLLGSLRYQF